MTLSAYCGVDLQADMAMPMRVRYLASAPALYHIRCSDLEM